MNHPTATKRLACSGQTHRSERRRGRKVLAGLAPQRTASLHRDRHDDGMVHLRPLLPWLLLLAFGTVHYSLQLRQQPRGVIRFRVIPQPVPQPRPALKPQAPLI